MNKITLSFEILATIIAVALLQACGGVAVTPGTQCAMPTLAPPSKSGPAGNPITVAITTATKGAYLHWTDDGSEPGGSSGKGNLIKASSGPAPTVFGRTLKAIAFKAGLGDSPIAVGHYTSARHP
jgi:hypothetical protein